MARAFRPSNDKRPHASSHDSCICVYCGAPPVRRGAHSTISRLLFLAELLSQARQHLCLGAGLRQEWITAHGPYSTGVRFLAANQRGEEDNRHLLLEFLRQAGGQRPSVHMGHIDV